MRVGDCDHSDRVNSTGIHQKGEQGEKEKHGLGRRDLSSSAAGSNAERNDPSSCERENKHNEDGARDNWE